MPFFLAFAWKNLFRHLRRTLITASALAVGLGVFLLVDSMLQGAGRETERNLVTCEFGSLRVASPPAAGDPEKLSLRDPLTDPGTLAALVRARGWTAAPRLAFEAELITGGREFASSRVVRALGIDPGADASVFSRKDLRIQGRWPGAGQSAVVLGRWLAEDLEATVGQGVTLTTRTREGSFQVLDLEVAGLVESPDPVVNRTGVYLPLDVVQAQLGMPGMVTEVAVGLPPGTDAAAEAPRLEADLIRAGFGIRVLSWEALAGDYLALAAGKQKGSSFILFLVFVIAAVGVGNTLMLAFYERKTEIGMLRALGMSDRRLFWTFVAEAAGIGVLGAAAGLVLGAALVAWIVVAGIDFTALIRQMDIGYRISGVFYGVWDPRSFVGAGVAGVLLAALCAVGPTRRALKLPITESLRAEG